MSSATSTTSLPSGLAVFTTFPDVLFIPEAIFGGLVWILVASSHVPQPMLQGWVMFVSVFCFVMTITLLFLYMCGAHGDSSSWVTLVSRCRTGLRACPLLILLEDDHPLISYCTPHLQITVFAFVATLLYVIHAIYSLRRWKSS
ncbi:MAL protein, partial [Penelope pileata]|nr:MAL protein [Penelope pileata]